LQRRGDRDVPTVEELDDPVGRGVLREVADVLLGHVIR
jgi:hypothetical protein